MTIVFLAVFLGAGVVLTVIIVLPVVAGVWLCQATMAFVVRPVMQQRADRRRARRQAIEAAVMISQINHDAAQSVRRLERAYARTRADIRGLGHPR
ncbi:hypothetical protein [Rhodococcus indonesiensis]